MRNHRRTGISTMLKTVLLCSAIVAAFPVATAPVYVALGDSITHG